MGMSVTQIQCAFERKPPFVKNFNLSINNTKVVINYAIKHC